MLSGDLNDLQQMALLSLMADEQEMQVVLENSRFRAMLIAMHPERAGEMLEFLDGGGGEDGELPEFADEMSEEEMDEYQPFSVEEAQATVELLRQFGVAVS